MNDSSHPESYGFQFQPIHVVEMYLRGYSGEHVRTPSVVMQEVESMLVGPLFAPLRASLNDIVHEILRRIDVRIGTASILEDCSDHEAWLENESRDQWSLWPRLHDFLRDEERLPREVLAELDRSTTQTLDRFESPLRPGRWDRRGLVVGHVQSGKTTHYTALAAKAIDAGYRIVIVLAGMHNSLRSQTHDRIDRHLIGRDSRALDGSGGVNQLIGVGDYARKQVLSDIPFSILTCTNSSENGDFKDRMARQVWFQVNDGARLVMVVKKNGAILRKLRDWLRMLLAGQSESGEQQLIPHPTLFIDDEADQASINTRDTDQDPSTINGLIRELLVSFSRVGLVGYTATPFANIFIDPSTTSAVGERFGPDLFPRSFIVSLKAPDNYVGPAVVFGHDGDESVGIPFQDPLPMYVQVTDSSAWISSPKKKDAVPGPLPDSLKEAIRVFVLVCSARAVRGDGQAHNSMLIHATRFVAVQSRVAEQVDTELQSLRTLLSHGSPSTVAELRNELEMLWQRGFVDPHPGFKQQLKTNCEDLPAWSDVWARTSLAAEKIQVMKINGSSDDALAYSRRPDGFSVIAIGGDKLSRGLTLEGLSVSYFLRTSSMFDTLMQMGRWFGYRPRYADLCRVYTTNDLYTSFREISLAIDDLRADLDRMAVANRTPEDFGLRVRTPSDRLLITAANKLRRGETIQVRFAGELVQALEIPAFGPAAQKNRDALDSLVQLLPPPANMIRDQVSSHFVWHNVFAERVMEFLTSYDAYRTHCFLGNCEQLRRYIQERVSNSELTEWTVCIVSKRAHSDTLTTPIGGIDVPLITRGADKAKNDAISAGHHVMRGVAGREEEMADLTDPEFLAALGKTHELERRDGKAESELSRIPDRQSVREARPSKRGLLLIYPIRHPGGNANEYLISVAVSFPDSPTATPLTYTVNDIWRDEYGFIDDEDDNDQSA